LTDQIPRLRGFQSLQGLEPNRRIVIGADRPAERRADVRIVFARPQAFHGIQTNVRTDPVALGQNAEQHVLHVGNHAARARTVAGEGPIHHRKDAESAENPFLLFSARSASRR
jgi:hypothetical protein